MSNIFAMITIKRSNVYTNYALETFFKNTELDKNDDYTDDDAMTQAINNISEDLRDRCGLFTNEVQNLIDDSKLLVMIKNTGVINIKSNSSKTSLLLSANINKSVFENILTLVTNRPNIYSINRENKFIIELNEDNSSLRRKTVIKLLNEII